MKIKNKNLWFWCFSLYNLYMTTKQATPEQARIAREYTGYIFAKMDGRVFSQDQEKYFADLLKIIETWPKNSVSVL